MKIPQKTVVNRVTIVFISPLLKNIENIEKRMKAVAKIKYEAPK